MAKDYRKELSFQAGEISPLFYGRTESEFYDKGLAIAENVRIDKRGGAFRRGGLENRGKLSATNGHVFTKQIHPHRFDIIMVLGSATFGDALYKMGTDLAFISPNLFSNGKFTSNASWTTDLSSTGSRVLFNGKNCRLLPEQGGSSQTSQIRQQVTALSSGTVPHAVRIQQAFGKSLNILIGTTSGASDIASFTNDKENFEVEFTPNNTTYWVTIESDSDDSVGNILVFAATTIPGDMAPVAVSEVSPWTEDQLDDLHITETPDGQTIYFLHPNVSPRKITYDFSTDTYGALVVVSFTAAPAEWTGTNFPGTGTFAQGRFWLGGTYNEPQTIWASVSASPEDMTTGAGDAMGFNFTLDQQGRIKWMLGSKGGVKGVLVGTENGEHIITSESGVITQTDFNIDQQSAYGSNTTQSIQVGEKVFYVTPDERKIQTMGYEWQENNWLSQDIAFASEHITKGDIKSIVWSQHPNAQLLVVLRNGDVATVTYDRTSQTIGWTRYLHTGMNIQDLAIGSVGGVSRLVSIGWRIVDEMEVEVEAAKIVYLDSYINVYHTTPSDTVGDLGHLEGEVVQVIVDDAVDPPQTVSGGSITTQRSGNSIFAGKQISSKIATLPPDVAEGQIRSWQKRWNKVWALMHLSAPPIINGVRPPDRSPSTPMDTPEPLSSRTHKSVSLGWDENGQVTIEENLPVAMNVLSIYGEMSREAL